MFNNDNASQNFVTPPSLYCVWIRANETPGAPLVTVWMDSKMRAFEEAEMGCVEATVDSGPEEEGPQNETRALTVEDVKHSV
jgi:hypothetical protein